MQWFLLLCSAELFTVVSWILALLCILFQLFCSAEFFIMQCFPLCNGMLALLCCVVFSHSVVECVFFVA